MRTLYTLATAASLTLGLALPIPSAHAADLGGDCCADLEARVAELESTAVKHENKKLKLTISGSVDYSMLYWSVAGVNTTAIVQNPNDASRVRFGAEGLVAKDIKVGAVTELGLGYDPLIPSSIEARSTYVYVEAGAIRATLGHQKVATDGVEGAGPVDLSMVAPILDVSSIGGGALFGEARQNAIRFDVTPVAGLHIAASYTPHSAVVTGGAVKDVSVDYSTVIAKTLTVTGTLGLRADDGAAGNTLLASAGVHDSVTGLFVQGGYGRSYGTSLVGWQAQAGLAKALIVPGSMTTIYAEYGRATLVTSADASLWGFGVTQDVGSTGATAFLGYRNYSDGGVTGATVLGGMKVDF